MGIVGQKSRDVLLFKVPYFSYVLDVQWVGHSDVLASSSHDGTVKIWDTGTGEMLHNLEEHQDKVSGISLTTDGAYLASAGHDGDVHFWSVEHGDVVNTHEGPGRIISVAFSRHKPEYVAVTSYGAVEVLRLEFNDRTQKRREEEHFEEDFDGDRGGKRNRGRGGRRDEEDDERDSGYDDRERRPSRDDRRHGSVGRRSSRDDDRRDNGRNSRVDDRRDYRRSDRDDRRERDRRDDRRSKR